MKKLDKLIKRLKKAKELLAKDALDEKIKAKMRAEMDRRGMTEQHIADHLRDTDETIPAKQRTNIKNAFKAQKLKEQPKPKLTVVKSTVDIADELIKSLNRMIGHITKPAEKSTKVNPHSLMTHNQKKTIQKPEQKQQVPKKQTPEEMRVMHAKDDKPRLNPKAKAQLDDAKAKANMHIIHERKVSKSRVEWSEDEMANALARVAPLGQPSLQPSNKEFEQAALNSGMAVTQKQADTLEKNWGGAIQDFFSEASKPISSRFASEEEEAAYWSSIKIADRDNGSSGY